MMRSAERQDDPHNELTLGPTGVKLQHYTPRFILEKFVGDDGTVLARDVDSNQKFRARPRRVAAQTYYYDLPIELDPELSEFLRTKGVPNARISSEPWFGVVESEAAGIVNRLVDEPDEIGVLSLFDQHVLARFFVAQYFRSPAYRQKTDAFNRRMYEGIRELVGGMAPGANLDDLKPTETGAAEIARMLRSAHGWANLLRTMDWRIGTVPVTHRLNTSDNMMSAHIPPVRLYSDLLNLSGFEYWIPLSPTVLLVLKPRLLGQQLAESGARYRKDYCEWESCIASMIVAEDATRNTFGDGHWHTRADANVQLQRIDINRQRIAVEMGIDPGYPILPPEYQWAKIVQEEYADHPSILFG